MKRIIALFLAAVLAAGLLSGCGEQAAATTEAPSAAQETTAAAAANTTAAPAATQAAAETEDEVPQWQKDHPTWLCEDKTTFTIMTEVPGSSFEPYSNDLPFWKWLEERTNVHLEWELIPSGYSEVVTTRLAAGESIPDIMWTSGMANANVGGENGVFVDIAQYWDCFPNTQAYFGDEYLKTCSNPEGQLYAVAGSPNPVEGHVDFLYNTKWMNELGAETPKNLDEFYNLLVKIKNTDLNGNGEADEIPLMGTWNGVSTCLYPAFGIPLYSTDGKADMIVQENGTAKEIYTSENVKELLRFLNKLYSEGLLDQEFSILNNDVAKEKVGQQRVGICTYVTANAISWGALIEGADADPYGEYFTIGHPLASSYNDNEGYFVKSNKFGGYTTAVSAECENIELACRWLDTLFADPEVLMVRTCGWEGEQYTIDDKGEIELIYPEDGSAWNITKLGCGQISLCFIQTKEQLLNSKMQYPWYIEEYKDIRENCKWVEPTIPKVLTYSADEQEVIDDVQADLLTYWQESRIKFVIGEMDIDNDWDEYCRNIKALGVDDLVDMYQAIYDRTK